VSYEEQDTRMAHSRFKASLLHVSYEEEDTRMCHMRRRIPSSFLRTEPP
jgi:hypothetical protein